MKTYVLSLSRTFPTTHRRKGEPTYFKEKVFIGQNKLIPCAQCSLFNNCNGYFCLVESIHFSPKIHTIRSNYELWAKRIKQVQEGKAILSLRYWSGKPYNSKQVEFFQLNKDSGIGVQKLTTVPPYYFVDDERKYDLFTETLAKNDGLSESDFNEWFKNCDLFKPMAIIHFTKFRY